MDQLLELIEMLGDDYLPYDDNKLGRRVYELFDYFRKTENPNEKEGANYIGLKVGSSAYRKVKHHLKLALINGVTVIVSARNMSIENRKEANDKSWNFVAATRVGLGPVVKFITGSKIAEITLIGAHKFDLQEPLLGVYLSLTDSRSTISRKKSLAVIRQAHVELDYDYKLQVGHALFVRSTFMNITRASNDQKTNYLDRAVSRMEGIRSVQRPRAKNIELYLGLKLRLSKGDFRSAIDFAKEALKSLDHEDPLQKNMVNVFKNNILRAYLNTTLHREGLNYARNKLTKTTPENRSFYATQELLMIMAMRSSEYDLAYSSYLKVLDSGKVDLLNQTFRETFLIIEAYLHLLISMNLIAVPPEQKKNATIRMGRFMNDMIESNKEKERRNIHVIIIKILEHALNKSAIEFVHADAIRKYVQRHLKDDQSLRAKNFILALIQFPEHGFSRQIALRKAQKYLQELSRYDLGQNGQQAYSEIVPYEKLWEHLMDII